MKLTGKQIIETRKLQPFELKDKVADGSLKPLDPDTGDYVPIQYEWHLHSKKMAHFKHLRESYPGNLSEHPESVKDHFAGLERELHELTPRLGDWRCLVMPDSKEERQEVIRRLKECVFEEEEVNAAFPGPHSGSAKEGRVISHKLRTIPGSDLFESFKISPEAFIHLLAGECLRGDLQIFDPFDCEVTKEDFMPLFEELEKTGAILKFAVTEGEAKPWRGKNDRVTTLALEQFKEWRYLEDDFKNLAKRYPNLAGTPPTEAQKRDPAKAEKGAGKKATALTRQAQKRLEEIVPVVKNFCQTLSASIKQEHGTVTHAEAKDWQKEALTLAEEQGAWNEVVKPEDVQAVDFAAHAVSEHKERLKGRLAQLVLAREGFGTKSQKALNKFFR